MALLSERAKLFIIKTIKRNIATGNITYARNLTEKHIDSLTDDEITEIDDLITPLETIQEQTNDEEITE